MGHFQLAGPSWAVVPGLTLVVLAILSGVETRWLDLDGRFRVRYFYLHHAPSEVPNTQHEHLKPTWHATWHHGGKYLQKAPCTILSSAFVPSSLPLRSLYLSHPERRCGETQRDAPVHSGGGPGEIPPGVLHHVEHRFGGPNRLNGAAEHSEEVEAGEVEVVE